MRARQTIAFLLISSALFLRASGIRMGSSFGTSMSPTIEDRDLCLFVPEATIQRGDICVVESPILGTLVKRVVALEGDTVEGREQSVYVNGELAAGPSPDCWMDYKSVVPDGCVYLLGDNLADSFDSRYWALDTVREDQVVGTLSYIWKR